MNFYFYLFFNFNYFRHRKTKDVSIYKIILVFSLGIILDKVAWELY